MEDKEVVEISGKGSGVDGGGDGSGVGEDTDGGGDDHGDTSEYLRRG